MKFLLTTLCVVAACFGLGLALGKSNSSQADAADGDRGQDGKSQRGVLTALSSSKGGSNRRAADAAAAIGRSPDAGLFDKMRGYLQLIRQVELDEIPALMAQLHREMPDGMDFAVEMLAERWAQEDPVGAMQALLANEPLILSQYYELIMKHAAEAAPARAWQMMLGNDAESTHVSERGVLGTMHIRLDYAQTLLSAIGSDDPELALQLMAASPNKHTFRDVFEDVLRDQLASTEPRMVLQRIDQIAPNGFGRGQIIANAIAELAKIDRAGAFEELAKLPSAEYGPAYQKLTASWAAEDPAAALEWAMNQPLHPFRAGALSAAIGAMAKEDPVTAAAQVSGLDSINTRTQAAKYLIAPWFAQDQNAAMEWTRNDLEPRSRSGVYEQLLVKHGGSLDLELQREMAEGINGRSNERTNFVERWVNSEPQAALDWAVANHTDNDRVMVWRAMQRWQGKDQDAAFEYVDSMADEKIRTYLNKRLKR